MIGVAHSVAKDEPMVAKDTIGHPLSLPLCLVVENIAPSTHQDPPLCAASVKQQQQNPPLFFYTVQLLHT